MDLIIILLLSIWIVLAFRYVKKHKNGCSGNCFSCLSHKKNLKKLYDDEKNNNQI